MDSYEWNKIFMGALSSALLVMLINWGTEVLFHVEELEAAVGYPIKVPDGPVARSDEPVDEGPSLAELLANATVEGGKKVFKKCSQCHSVEQGGSNGTGPNLWNTVHQDVADNAAFAYSGVMGGLEGNWTPEQLNLFLTAPTKWLRGTKMSFAGLKKPKDRAAIIKYLWSQGDQSQALPSVDMASAE
ncbi:MAG: cytochrome c family protein [Pseudomonadota bacterium]